MDRVAPNEGHRGPDPNATPHDLDNGDGDILAAHEAPLFFDDVDSNCSTPYVSAPSSPGRGSGAVAGYFYSAPTSPMHFALSSSAIFAQSSSSTSCSVHEGSYEFEFSSRFVSSGSGHSGSMSSADELFLNGQIRPMKLSTHLERPQLLAPLLDLENEEADDDEEAEKKSGSGGRNGADSRGRDLRLRDKSIRRRTRSMSPLRNMPLEWNDEEEDSVVSGRGGDFGTKDGQKSDLEEQGISGSKVESLSTETTPSVSASSSRSSSAGRSSKRWVFLKDFLRSKSEGRSNNKFWATISFSPVKDKGRPTNVSSASSSSSSGSGLKDKAGSIFLPFASSDAEKIKKSSHNSNMHHLFSSGKRRAGASGGHHVGKPVNGAGKRRVPPSPHELHYTANRAQAEELRKKTFLPYKQGLLGCLGFSSKGYGAMNGFARALNPVSSR